MEKNSTSVFEKKMQEVFKAIYAEGIKESWSDPKMQEFCVKCNCLFVPFRSNTIVVGMEKPHIQKSFWFGYSDFGQGPSFEECNETEDAARKNAVSYFMDQNLRYVNNTIKKVRELIEHKNSCWYKYYFQKHYTGESESNPVCCISYFDRYQDRELHEGNYLTDDELNFYLEALNEYRNLFVKRLNTYLKKYGVSKLDFNTYWMDR